MELIRIQQHNGNQVVSARELYTFLGYDKSQWSRWYSKNIINNEYAVENEDYQELDFESRSSKTKDFSLTIDFAKKLSMLARTDKGEGTEVLEVNVKTFRNKHYCSVAEMPEMRLTPELVERVGNQMLDDLAAK